jgi:outer membrane protein
MAKAVLIVISIIFLMIPLVVGLGVLPARRPGHSGLRMIERVVRRLSSRHSLSLDVGTHVLSLCMSVALLLSSGIQFAHAAEIKVRLDNPPSSGTLVFLLFDSANTFGDLRNPLRRTELPSDDREIYRFEQVPAGEYAMVIYCDENGNGLLDKNFAGIPTEPMAFSNQYKPKGPPSFSRSRFELSENEIITFEVELIRPLGKFGRFGAGIGLIARSSPYRGSDEIVLQPIPALTYNGERLQLFGPGLRFGLLGSDNLRLAATASYRIGAYEEGDSPALRGLGDRKDTIMTGLAVIYELPEGINLRAGYEHDMLDRIGGGSARIGASKSFQCGAARLTPTVGVNWLSSKLSHHDFGVPRNKVTPDRPAYRVDDTFSIEAGAGAFVELSRDWKVVLNMSVEFLEDKVCDSPIVSDAQVFKGFAALNYVF